MNSKLKTLLSTFAHRLEDRLHYYLPMSSQSPQILHQAMRYSSLDAGKRIRPFLVYAAGKALDCPLEKLDPAAVAVELIHCYSLVHDDMPAMDNDDLRRGKQTCHLQFDEATALLTGDALQTLAFEVLSHSPALSAEAAVACIRILSSASGSQGMAGGQAIDLAAVGKQLNLEALKQMHLLKTGALIRASVKMACAVSDDSREDILFALDSYAMHLGLAFQIQDDVLDIEGETEILGKPQGSDQQQNKPTYPGLMGLGAAKDLAYEHKEAALNALADFDHKADPLRWLADFVISRSY